MDNNEQNNCANKFNATVKSLFVTDAIDAKGNVDFEKMFGEGKYYKLPIPEGEKNEPHPPYVILKG